MSMSEIDKMKLVDGLVDVLPPLLKVWVPEVAKDWMFGSNGFLGGSRPIDVLMIRGPEEVLSAIEQTASGAYA